MMKLSNKNFKTWFVRGTIGVLLTGAGISMIVEAGFYKHAGAPLLYWVLAGTASLIVFMAGLTLFVDSVRYRIRWENERDDKEGLM